MSLLLAALMVWSSIGLEGLALAATGSVTVSVETATLLSRDSRTYEVTYTVTSVPDTRPNDLVLVLDRSNSMLFDINGTAENTNLDPSVKAVKASVLAFIQKVLSGTEDNRVSLVFFGGFSKAPTPYYTAATLAQALAEVEYYYGYYKEETVSYALTDFLHLHPIVTHTQYKWNHDNDLPNFGGTNLEAAFYTAGTALASARSGANRAAVLFTDGVATFYGTGASPTRDNQNPTTETTAIRNAVTAGKTLCQTYSVYNVGYLANVPSGSLALATSTLTQTQNAGQYVAPTLAQLDDVFNRINSDLDYTGTNAVVTDILPKEFTLDQSTMTPTGSATVTANADGTTKIVWNIGTMGASTYVFKYRVSVKNTVYLSGAANVPVSSSVVLTYEDNAHAAASRTISPAIVTVTAYLGSPVLKTKVNASYLVGDAISMTNNVSYYNANSTTLMYYAKNMVRQFGTAVSGGGIALAATGYWTVAADKTNAYVNFNTKGTIASKGTISYDWVMTATAKAVGTYSITDTVAYAISFDKQPTTSDATSSNTFSFSVLQGSYAVHVRTLSGAGLAGATVSLRNPNGVLVGTALTTTATGDVTFYPPSGTYTVQVTPPAGYSGVVGNNWGAVEIGTTAPAAERTFQYSPTEPPSATLADPSLNDASNHYLVGDTVLLSSFVSFADPADGSFKSASLATSGYTFDFINDATTACFGAPLVPADWTKTAAGFSHLRGVSGVTTAGKASASAQCRFVIASMPDATNASRFDGTTAELDYRVTAKGVSVASTGGMAYSLGDTTSANKGVIRIRKGGLTISATRSTGVGAASTACAALPVAVGDLLLTTDANGTIGTIASGMTLGSGSYLVSFSAPAGTRLADSTGYTVSKSSGGVYSYQKTISLSYDAPNTSLTMSFIPYASAEITSLQLIRQGTRAIAAGTMVIRIGDPATRLGVSAISLSGTGIDAGSLKLTSVAGPAVTPTKTVAALDSDKLGFMLTPAAGGTLPAGSYTVFFRFQVSGSFDGSSYVMTVGQLALLPAGASSLELVPSGAQRAAKMGALPQME